MEAISHLTIAHSTYVIRVRILWSLIWGMFGKWQLHLGVFFFIPQRKISFRKYKKKYEKLCWRSFDPQFFFSWSRKMMSPPPPSGDRDFLISWGVHFSLKTRAPFLMGWDPSLNQIWKDGFLWNISFTNQTWRYEILRRRVNNEIHP